MVERDLPGYAVGGLAGGEAKEPFWRVVHMCCQALPPNKPRYLMGVGYPLDLVVRALGTFAPYLFRCLHSTFPERLIYLCSWCVCARAFVDIPFVGLRGARD